jgi:CRISPR/Cas system CSM-associated protein Csm3 (group 7 of RAMP superfamily)
MRYTADELEHLALVVRHELSLFLGEWFMDNTKGIPYLPTSSRKSAHRALLETAIRAKIISITGIKRLTQFTPQYDKRERLLQIYFQAETELGTLKSSWSNEGVLP